MFNSLDQVDLEPTIELVNLPHEENLVVWPDRASASAEDGYSPGAVGLPRRSHVTNLSSDAVVPMFQAFPVLVSRPEDRVPRVQESDDDR